DARGLQILDQLDVARLLKERDDRSRDLVADSMYFRELGFRLRRDDVEAAEAAGQQLRHSLADQSDAKRVEQASEAAIAWGRDRGDQVPAPLPGKPADRRALPAGQVIEAGKLFARPGTDHLLDRPAPEVPDAHAPPRPEVAHPLLKLARAGGVGAPPVRLALQA